MAESFAQASRADNIDPTAQRFLQVHDQLAVVEQALSSVKIDDQVEVTLWRLFTPRDRSKNPHVACPMGIRQREDLVSARPQLSQGRCLARYHVQSVSEPARRRNCPHPVTGVPTHLWAFAVGAAGWGMAGGVSGAWAFGAGFAGVQERAKDYGRGSVVDSGKTRLRDANETDWQGCNLSG